MRPVHVLIFHAEAAPGSGPRVGALAEARLSLAERQRPRWPAAGADSVGIVAGPLDGRSFGERLRRVLRTDARIARGGLIVLGSGSLALARVADLRRFVEVAAGPGGHALANNRYSADVVALSRAADLEAIPALPSDNALPRWLEERAGVVVADLGRRWRLGVDVDTPLDLLVLAEAGAIPGRGHAPAGGPAGGRPLVGERLAALSDVVRNRRAELLVSGRVSNATLQFLQRGVECRVRALVEERGLRAASRLAQGATVEQQRPPRSVLGTILDRDGPESLARHVAALADAAVIDTRVLMAHRFGALESAWPGAEDRFASDLLEASDVADPWLAALTASAVTAPGDHPILLGGHTMVNGGLRLLAENAARPEAAAPRRARTART
jgi:hypothetical protein